MDRAEAPAHVLASAFTTPDLHSLSVKFFSEGRWNEKRVIITDAGVHTLRYSNIQHGPFFSREGDVWKATVEPWRLFGVPVRESEQKFITDYVAHVAETATELHSDPTRAPVCIPQLVFKPHPADFAFLYAGQWRVLEIDGPSHFYYKGAPDATQKRDERYKAGNALVVALHGWYNSLIPPDKMMGGLETLTPWDLGYHMALRIVHDPGRRYSEDAAHRVLQAPIGWRTPSMPAILEILGIVLTATLAMPA